MSLQKLQAFLLPILCSSIVTALVLISAPSPVGVKILGIFCVSMILFALMNARYIQARKTILQAEREHKDLHIHQCHALRSPLAVICGIAEMFEGMQHNLNDVQKELVQTLSSSAAAMQELITIDKA